MFKTPEDCDNYFNALLTADEKPFVGVILSDESILIGRVSCETILDENGIPTTQAVRLRGHNLGTRSLKNPDKAHWVPMKNLVGSAHGLDIALVARMVAEIVAQHEMTPLF